MVGGREVNKRLSGYRTKKEAQQAYVAFIAQESPEKLADTGLMFGALVEAYLAYLRNNNKESSVYTLENKIRTRILPYFESRRVASIKALDVQTWTDTLTDCSYSYKQSLRGQLSALLRYADRYYDIPTVMTKVAPIRNTEPVKELEYWSEEDYGKFIAAIPDKYPQHKMYFELLYLLGCRKGEALALSWDDIDMERGLISISKNITRKVDGAAYKVTTPKNRASVRTISIPASLCRRLEEYKHVVFPSAKTSDFVFGGGAPLSDRTTDRVFAEACKLAGVKKIRLHDLRHSCASMLISRGVSIVAVSKRLGHSNIEQTLNTYSHLMPRDDEMMLDIIDDIIGTVPMPKADCS
jgi:integrase